MIGTNTANKCQYGHRYGTGSAGIISGNVLQKGNFFRPLLRVQERVIIHGLTQEYLRFFSKGNYEPTDCSAISSAIAKNDVTGSLFYNEKELSFKCL